MSEPPEEELESLFRHFDEKLAECQQKFCDIEKNLQEFRQDNAQPPAGAADAPGEGGPPGA